MMIQFLVLTLVFLSQIEAMQPTEMASQNLVRRFWGSIPKQPFFDSVRWCSSSPFLQSGKQIYTIPTYDAAFKWVLSEDDIRLSFLHAFVSNVIASSERLDDHMNPVEKLQILRNFLHQETTQSTVETLLSSHAYVIIPSKKGEKDLTAIDESATSFLKMMVERFDEIKTSFPSQRYDGTMDFVCQLNNGEYALVEMQVVPQNYWDRRALAYVSAFYGNQLSRGEQWKSIKRVIGLNILGGGKEEKVHWVDTPSQFVRHYKFEDQFNGKGRYIDGIELIQYSIMNAPTVNDQEQQDWFTFLKEAHRMTEDDVKSRVMTPAVLKAFERAKISDLPGVVKDAYEAEDKEYDRYSDHTNSLIEDGKKKGKAEGEVNKAEQIARALIAKKMDDAFISDTTGLTLEQVQALRI